MRARLDEARGTLHGYRMRDYYRELPPGVRYPSYKSMDAFVDVERLRSLDATLRERVARFLSEGETRAFDTGIMKANPLARRRPGSRLIELTASTRPFRYYDVLEPSLWRPTPAAEVFSDVMDFVRTLPFAQISRVIVMCDPEGRAVTVHRDHAYAAVLQEFVWFRTSLDKPFFVTDRRRRERRYVRSFCAWFDTVNQLHGADATGKPSISLRVDGRFDDALRARIPTPATNPASTPSLWACREGEA